MEHFLVWVSAIVDSIQWNIGSEERGRYVPPRENDGCNALQVQIPDKAREKIARLKPALDQLRETGEDGLLGCYFAMRPRGQIALDFRGLRAFFWQVLVEVLADNQQMTAWQLSRLADATVWKTLCHEQFHHMIDVLMLLFGTHQYGDRLHEEALAVAYSHHEISQGGGGRTKDWFGLPPALRNSFLDHAYRHTAPGYRDWPKFAGLDWKDATLKYVMHPNVRSLIPLERWTALGMKPFNPRRHTELVDVYVLNQCTELQSRLEPHEGPYDAFYEPPPDPLAPDFWDLRD